MIVLSNPVAGREDEYNDWYTNRHLADVLKVPGFKSARRFKLAQDDPAAKWKYLAIYDFESDEPAKTLAALNAAASSPEMVLSEAMDMSNFSMSPWVAICDKQTAKK
ncbi:MAG: DUF4286 family protein [Georgfuchsia sp.]